MRLKVLTLRAAVNSAAAAALIPHSTRRPDPCQSHIARKCNCVRKICTIIPRLSWDLGIHSPNLLLPLLRFQAFKRRRAARGLSREFVNTEPSRSKRWHRSFSMLPPVEQIAYLPSPCDHDRAIPRETAKTPFTEPLPTVACVSWSGLWLLPPTCQLR